jgi:predicted  nucleic acid-binding Zn-ribbon protein
VTGRPSRPLWGATISELRKIDQKLQHLRRVEASYRSEIRRAFQAMKDNPANSTKAEVRYKKVKAKFERRIDKLQPKIKHFTVLRSELKDRGAAKG